VFDLLGRHPENLFGKTEGNMNTKHNTEHNKTSFTTRKILKKKKKVEFTE
jgi:hypothetical protein